MNRGIARNIRLIITWYINLNFALLAFIIAWLDRKLRFPLRFPRDTEALANKQEWCIGELKKNGILPEQAIIKGYRVKPLNREVIFRSNIGTVEINYNYLGEDKTLMCVAKFAPLSGTVWNRAVFNMQLNHIKEISFNRYFIQVDKIVPSPAVYYAEQSVFTGNLCLIAEYVDGDEEYAADGLKTISDTDLQLVLDGLSTLHAAYWNDTSARMRKVYPIEDNIVDFFDSIVAGKWSIPARKILVQSWHHSNECQTIIHGDARAGNMIFPRPGGEGRFVFIDWQAVRQGQGAFDLAYFLVLSLPPAKRQMVEQQSIDTYHRHLLSKGLKGYTRAELEDDYKHGCLCVLVLLALPMLSGEASAEGTGAIKFAWGMNIWRLLMQVKFEDFDYAWLAKNYGITEKEGRDALTEMLTVIDSRLKAINAGAAV